MSREEDELEKLRRQNTNLWRDLAPLLTYFDIPTVTDINVYSDGSVEIVDFDKGSYEAVFILTVSERLRIINSLSSISDTPIDTWERPTLESIIPGYNIRTTAILPPWLNAPQITFRRPPNKIHTLDDYFIEGRLSKEFYDKINFHLAKRSNIVVSGSTGSGKTTFANALIDKMVKLTPGERIYIVEDVPELQCAEKHKIQLYIRKEQAVNAVQTALRFTPKRIIFGEIRSGAVALELLESWISGHPGNLTTIHAENAATTILRFKGLLRQVIAGQLPDLSWYIQLIIHLGSRPGLGPYVDEVCTLNEIDSLNKTA